MTTPLITRLNTENWLGTPSVDLTLTPFTLLCGPNGAGKTSLLEAINFGLFGAMPRSADKKADLPTLLSRGATSGTVTVEIAGRAITRSIKTGQIGKVAVPALPDLAPWILSPGTFSARPEGERRKQLSTLLEVKATPDAIGERLAKAGLPPSMVTELKTEYQRAGFAAAEKKAKERASEARGAWQTITGANYGSKVADGWQPDEAEAAPSAAERDEATTALATVTGEIAGLNQAIGAASRAMASDTRAALTTEVERLPKWIEAQTRGQARYTELQAKIIELTPKAASNGGTTTPCPHCAKPVVIDAGHLRKPTDAVESPVEAHTQLRDAKGELETVNADLARCRTAIAAGDAAKARLAAAEGDVGTDVDQLRAELEQKTSRQASLAALVRIHASKLEREQSTLGAALKASIEHKLVVDYSKAAELLSANGIPSIIVAQTLGPVNELLEKASAAARWPTVRIDAEMELWFGETPYGLASESECWRMDAAMAFVLAELTGLRVLVLDRLDVLVDTPAESNRSNVLRWLHGLAGDGWQVIAAASLKEAPKIPNCTAIWLDARTSGRAAA